MRPRFWELPLADLDKPEWEALCDGCGKCCLNKLEDADTGQVFFTRIGCRLLDDTTCRCAHYENRKQFVPECVVLTPKNIGSTGIKARRTHISFRPGSSEEEGHYVDVTFKILACEDGELYTKFKVAASDWAAAD